MKKSKKEIREYLETNENETITCQNLWDAAKIILVGKFIVINAYIKKEERSQINNIILHLKEQEKLEQTNHKISIRKEIIKIRTKINDIENRETVEKSAKQYRK